MWVCRPPFVGWGLPAGRQRKVPAALPRKNISARPLKTLTILIVINTWWEWLTFRTLRTKFPVCDEDDLQWNWSKVRNVNFRPIWGSLNDYVSIVHMHVQQKLQNEKINLFIEKNVNLQYYTCGIICGPNSLLRSMVLLIGIAGGLKGEGVILGLQ